MFHALAPACPPDDDSSALPKLLGRVVLSQSGSEEKASSHERLQSLRFLFALGLRG